jgi:hypothetical protein
MGHHLSPAVQIDRDNLSGAPIGEEQPIVVPPRRLDQHPIVKQHPQSGHGPMIASVRPSRVEERE